MAGLKEIPVLVKEFTDQEMVEISLIENIQREDLNPVEEAEAYKRLIDEFHLKQDEIAERVSKSRTAITNVLRLLKLDNRVQHASVAGIEPKLVNLEAVKRNLRRAVCDDAVAHDLRKVAHAL